MGLDMYLSARLYTSEYSNRAAHTVLEKLELPGVTRPVMCGHGGGISLEVPVMYWRKANAIHAWFVTNVQGGEDDCRDANVSEDHLRELFQLVGELLDARKTMSQAKVNELVLEKLPPTNGFFFGSTDIDQYFWEDLQETHNLLAKLIIGQLDKDLLKGWDFYYHSSW